MLSNIPTTPYINPELSYSKTLLASLGINEVVEIKGSHWYCDPSVVKKEVIFGPTTTIFVGGQEVVDATLIKSMQNSMFFQLAIGDESVIANNNRNLSLIINGTSTQVDRELVCKQSSVLKQLIESSSEVEEVQAEYLQKVITFIHDEKLGIESAKFTSQQDVGLVNLKDLIELIKLADKYQVESLLVEISKVVNDLTAMIIIEECNTISNIGKKIVLEKCYEFIGFNPPSIVAAKVYKDKPLVTNFMEDLMKKMQELNIQAEDEITDYIVKEYDNHVDISNNRKNFAKFVSALRMDATLITFSELDTETLFGILNSKYLAMKPELILCVLASWYFADTTNRLEIACQYILENNWSDCGREIYNFIFHNVFIFSAMKLENSDLQDKLRDLLSQTMFKKENVMGKEWDLYNQNKPQRGLYINFGGDVRVLMLGLDHSGKTSILYVMKLGEIVNTIPTIGFNVETVNHSGSNLTVWDVGGQDKIRPLWRHYYTGTSIIVYVVDANDRERFDDACDCIQRLASEDELKDCPILIFANKMDRAGCASIEEIIEKLELKRLNNPNWMVQGCSVTEKVGLDEGFKLVLKALNIKSASIEQVTAQENEKVPKTTSHFGRFEPKFNSF